MPKERVKPEREDARSQSQKFIDTAREREADTDEEEFRRAVKEIAKATTLKPKKTPPKKAR